MSTESPLPAQVLYDFGTSPTTVNGLTVPRQEDVVPQGFGRAEAHLSARMGILFIELTAERSVAVMPVNGNEQPYGLLHGGAHCVLGETLGSFSANLYAFPHGRMAVGVDLNATHTGPATSGWVTGVCTPIHLGRSMTVHEIAITDADGKRCSTVRITNYLKALRDEQARTE